MTHWEDELQQLLGSLGVSFDGSSALLPQTESSDDQPHILAGSMASETDEGQQLVQSEVEATINEVARLAGSGALPAAVHDDVLRVLRALTRPSPEAGSAGQEWDLASAVAVLHFCRIVQRMTAAISQLNRG